MSGYEKEFSIVIGDRNFEIKKIDVNSREVVSCFACKFIDRFIYGLRFAAERVSFREMVGASVGEIAFIVRADNDYFEIWRCE